MQKQTVKELEEGYAEPAAPTKEPRRPAARAAQDRPAQELSQLIEREHAARTTADRLAERLQRLQRIAAALAQVQSPEEVARAVVQQGVEALEAHAGTVGLLNADEHTVELASAIGYAEATVEAWRTIPLEASTPLTDAIRTGEPVWLGTRAERSRRYPMLKKLQQASGGGALVALPLQINGKLIGGMGLVFSTTRRFSADDRAFFITVAQQCAQALERARLYMAERQTRLEAEAAVQLRDQFLSIAAHELKTPVTAMLGYAELLERRLKRSGPVEPRNQEALTNIKHQASRLRRLVDALLDLTRLQSGRLTIEPGPLDLNAMVYQLIAEIRPIFGSHEFEVDDADVPLFIRGDALRLEQVIYNVIQNAVKYSERGSTIYIHIGQKDQRACVAVRDTGMGIPAGDLPRLFDLFYRGGNVDPRQIAGMGLGLFVVREIVALHDGALEVESKEGYGTTVTISFPLQQG